ncbi:MAG: nitroreductase family deazaflavin-dependent oxidoreductase [Sandaracinaceae bacterium]|jgi:deazaflavin-dependent oxidoreductase (nitroreductase family)|nr:nitroreductase family deazaflavin-dependent oxidoreductase [Sandaracinaceae bacterium]MBP7681958.1 nitroreductase family deazaflavin-dependent oxidoreductase [Deltaproteobacteria bacterium]MBK6808612.1 nitroreductase family deazaflavin-dependent oxidoreductase [Sandaracinaceae bacterium]MBK7150184.1 nitroreductase family deazaflavin-dependent oxidoreductase [Sandaracinaceae bacterium]MBK7774251.1 nitroreductase family deazaflavin-dependent oxidoreductase [Sandaracinaceae bacterium]
MAKKQVVRERPEGLDKPWVKPFMNRMTKANVWVYQKTNGLIGSKWRVGAAFPQGVPVCLLTTTGRKSGEERVVPLLYLMEGESVVVVASTGGMPKNPAWFFNIKDNPECEVQVMGKKWRARARVADAAERAQLWPKLVELYFDYDNYQRWTDRVIPVVVLDPI